MTAIGVVGLGRMGLPMARRLAAAGWEVVGMDTSEEARSRARATGLRVVDQPGNLANAAVVMTSLPNTPEVEEVYLGATGILRVLPPRSLCVDLSTISIEASRRVAATAQSVSIDFVDAPVSGTSLHAEEGTLAVMVGGDEASFMRAVPYLQSLAASVRHVGPNGAGLTMKLISNRLLTSVLVAISEAITEIEAAEVDMATALEVLRAGAVPRLLDYKAGPMANRDFTPRFTVDLMVKDLGLAAESFPPGRLAALSESIVREAQAAGYGPADIGAVIEMMTR